MAESWGNVNAYLVFWDWGIFLDITPPWLLLIIVMEYNGLNKQTLCKMYEDLSEDFSHLECLSDHHDALYNLMPAPFEALGLYECDRQLYDEALEALKEALSSVVTPKDYNSTDVKHAFLVQEKLDEHKDKVLLELVDLSQQLSQLYALIAVWCKRNVDCLDKIYSEEERLETFGILIEAVDFWYDKANYMLDQIASPEVKDDHDQLWERADCLCDVFDAIFNGDGCASEKDLLEALPVESGLCYPPSSDMNYLTYLQFEASQRLGQLTQNFSNVADLFFAKILLLEKTNNGDYMRTRIEGMHEMLRQYAGTYVGFANQSLEMHQDMMESAGLNIGIQPEYIHSLPYDFSCEMP